MLAKQSGVRGRGRACGRNLLALKPIRRTASGISAKRSRTLADERLIKHPDPAGNRLRRSISVRHYSSLENPELQRLSAPCNLMQFYRLALCESKERCGKNTAAVTSRSNKPAARAADNLNHRFKRRLGASKLALIQVRVNTLLFQKFRVGTALDDASLLHDEYLVGLENR